MASFRVADHTGVGRVALLFAVPQVLSPWNPLRVIVLENLAEEENPSRPHPKLWRDFAEALGVNEEDITCCPALPGTQTVVETFREIVGDRPVAEAVAALYAYESQVPEIAATKIDGLNRFYFDLDFTWQ